MLTFRTNSANNVAVEPKQTAFSLLDLGAVGKQKEKEMKDEGGMVKGEGLQSAVGSGQSAADANANGRDLRDAAEEEDARIAREGARE